MTVQAFVRTAALVAFLGLFSASPVPALGNTFDLSARSTQAEPEDKTPGAELAQGTRESVEEEENENLKHSAPIRYLAKKTGLTVHQVHIASVIINFLLVALLLYMYLPKLLPAASRAGMRARTESIQRALEEARIASQDASRRLAEIEARLSRLDTEIAQMQTQSEREAEAEEARIKQAAEEDIRKVVRAAEQEIAAAAKLARRELAVHAADLAVALARKQIHVDSTTDQVLVRSFAGKLSSGSGGKDRQ